MDVLDAIFPGSVVVMHPGDDTTASHWGKLMSMTARSKGATGAVITGGSPDSVQILEFEFPVFRKDHMPATAVYRHDITDFDVPVRIGGGGITPGDFILGDIDGILVIPVVTVDEFIEKAESVREPEDIVRKALHEGGNIRDLFEKYRVL